MNDFFKKIHKNDVFIHPTEGIWGLGVYAVSLDGFEKLCALKGRGADIPCVCLTYRETDVKEWVDVSLLTSAQWDYYQENKVTFTTFILPASIRAPRHCVKNGKIAIRINQQKHIKDLVDFFDSPIISSSANLTGQPPAQSLEEAASLFPSLLISPGALGLMAKPSSIYDLIEERYIRL
jgi:L-threonylcarbamoyladenylate synthase